MKTKYMFKLTLLNFITRHLLLFIVIILLQSASIFSLFFIYSLNKATTEYSQKFDLQAKSFQVNFNDSQYDTYIKKIQRLFNEMDCQRTVLQLL